MKCGFRKIDNIVVGIQSCRDVIKIDEKQEWAKDILSCQIPDRTGDRWEYLLFTFTHC